MRQIKFLINTILFTIILFLPASAVLGQEGDCPTCGGWKEPPPFLDPPQDIGCCEYGENQCKAPSYRWECEDYLKGSFVNKVMSCDPKYKCEKPTAIRLSSFNVTQQDGQNLIVWITGTEIDTEGFHILRSTSAAGTYSRVTPSMIVSTGSAFAGGRYSFVDTAIESGKSYYYKLEEVDARGNMAQYGPVAAVADQGGGGSADLYGRPADNSEPVAGDTPTLALPRQGGGNKGGSVYTIMAYADGPAKFLSGEVVDEETVQGIRSQVLDPPHLTSPLMGEGKDVGAGGGKEESRDRPSGLSNEGKQNQEILHSQDNIKGGEGYSSPASLQFRIIDADGNEVAVASLEANSPPPHPSPVKVEGVSEGGILEDAKSGDFALQKRWDGDRFILTWHATKPVKGFHLLRSTTKEGPYQRITKTLIPYVGTGIEGVTGQLFRFTYTDKNVQKDKGYYYKLETISREDKKSALR